MKPTQLAELFANIRKTIVSFFSILMFVALGVGIFLGISWAGPALEAVADRTYDEGAFHDFQVSYLYGLTDDGMAEISGVEGVTDVEGARLSFQAFRKPDGELANARVQSLTERIDVPVAVEGTLPEKPDEIALSSYAAKELGLGVGDQITFEKDIKDGEEDPMAEIAALETQADGAQGKPEPQPKDEDGMKYLKGATYKVTGLVNSPEFIANLWATYGISTLPSGAVDIIAWVPATAFDASAFQNAYPLVDITCSGLAGMGSYDREYGAASDALQERLDILGQRLASARFEDLHGKAQDKVNQAEEKLAETKKKIEDGEKQIADGTAQLEEKRTQGEAALAEARKKLEDGEELYNGKRAELDEAWAMYNSAISRIEGIRNEVSALNDEMGRLNDDLNAGRITKEEYDQRLAELEKRFDALIESCDDLLDSHGVNIGNFDDLKTVASALLNDYRSIRVNFRGQTMTLYEAEQSLNDAEATANASYAELQDGWAKYNAGVEELNRAVAEGEQKIAEGKAQVEEAKKAVAENEPKLVKAKEQLADMKDPRLTVMPRDYNAGYAQITVIGGVLDRLSYSMAALFIIVGLLVSYSAVSRIVHEQVTQIGTKKALGLRAREITMSFLMYSGIAVIAGAIIGTIVGIIAVEGIIGHVLSSMFTFDDYPPFFEPVLFLIVSLVELALVLGATWLACRGILKRHAIELLSGEEAPSGKERFYEKWAVWEKASLLTQTIVNNCFNDKRRVFSTIVGVTGCTALIITAITLNNDVLKSYDRHFEGIYHFNALAYVDTSVDEAAERVDEALEAQGAKATPALLKFHVITQPDGSRGSLRLVVPQDASSFGNAYSVNPVSGGSFDPSGEGAWVSQAYCEHFGAKVGDIIQMQDDEGAVHEVPILGIYEFWLPHNEAVMASEYYEKEFGEAPVTNVVLADTGDVPVAKASEKLKGVDGFDSLVDEKQRQRGNYDVLANVSSAVVLIYMALAVLMAIIVLLNLNVMFIDEKKRELIVLMINGFSVKDAKRYIYNDTIVLTAIGIVLGIVLGCIMGSITVGALESSMAMFMKGIDLTAVLVGIVSSAVLSFVMSVIALRRIPRFDLTDINKF